MLIRIRLAEADRARLGAPEWLEVDPQTLTAREVMALQAGFTVPETGQHVHFAGKGAWWKALIGEPLLDEHGEPVLLDVLDADGQPVLDDEGQPKREPARVPDFSADLFLVWFGLRRAGRTIPLVDVDYDLSAREMALDLDGELGKAGSTPTTTSTT